MTTEFSYNILHDGETSSINIFTKDTETVVHDPSGDYIGLEIVKISGSFDGKLITGAAGPLGVYIHPGVNSYDQDNTIFISNSQGEAGEGSIHNADGIDNPGVAFSTNDHTYNFYSNDSKFYITYSYNNITQISSYYQVSLVKFIINNAAMPCYCTGTLILTDEGEVPVEALKVGDLVITAAGECRPVAWIGHRSLDITRHPEPAAVWPVLITAGAFAENLPARDLWISPRHAVFVDEVLIPIVRLENGTTIRQVPRPRVTYWHVELSTHDILVAEGLPAESYLDCGNRTAFANGGTFVELYPDFAPKTLAETYAPLKETGAEVAAAKRRLLDRAEVLGFGTTEDPALHILADGVTILPNNLGGGRFAFELPETSGDIRLVSRLWCPAHLDPVSGDRRFLGVLVTRLEIDGRLHDLAALGEGWLEVDGEPGSRCRWTAGPAALPSGGRQVMVRIGGKPRYWTAPAQDDRSGRGRCAA